MRRTSRATLIGPSSRLGKEVLYSETAIGRCIDPDNNLRVSRVKGGKRNKMFLAVFFPCEVKSNTILF